MLTEWLGVSYAQEQHKSGFFIDMKKVLPSSSLVRGDSGGYFALRGKVPRPNSGAKTKNWQDCCLISSKQKLDRCRVITPRDICMTPSARFVTLATIVALFVLLVQTPRVAQAGPAEKSVRVLYLVPKDREPRKDYQSAIEACVLDLQIWSFGHLKGKTFRLNHPIVEVMRTRTTQAGMTAIVPRAVRRSRCTGKTPVMTPLPFGCGSSTTTQITFGSFTLMPLVAQGLVRKSSDPAQTRPGGFDWEGCQ